MESGQAKNDSIHSRHPIKNCKHDAKICGKIFQKCDTDPVLYYRAVDDPSSAIVQVENFSTCVMRALITLDDGRIIVEHIEQNQQISVSVPSLKKLEIECKGKADQICRGSYSLHLRQCHEKCSKPHRKRKKRRSCKGKRARNNKSRPSC